MKNLKDPTSMKPTESQRKSFAAYVHLAEAVKRIDGNSSLDAFLDAAELIDSVPIAGNIAIKQGLMTLLDAIDISIDSHPDIGSDLKAGVHALLSALVEAAGAELPRDLKESALQAKRMTGLLPLNTAKAEISAQAKMIAAELWQADHDKKIRMGGMAELVYRKLASEDHSEFLPDQVDRVKDWIRDIAPPYAKKGGRPRKN